MAEQFQLREVFNPALVKELAGNIRRVWVEFEEGALRLMGYDPETRIVVPDLKLNSDEIRVGEELRFSFKVRSEEERPSSLMIDTVIHYMKANGQQKPKVFKAAKRSIGPGETIVIERARSFKVINTRPYYAGKHALKIQVNGKRYAWADFTLTPNWNGAKGANNLRISMK